MHPLIRRDSRGEQVTWPLKANVTLLQIAYIITHRRVGDRAMMCYPTTEIVVGRFETFLACVVCYMFD